MVVCMRLASFVLLKIGAVALPERACAAAWLVGFAIPGRFLLRGGLPSWERAPPELPIDCINCR